MDMGIRFSPPVPDEKDLNLLVDLFQVRVEELKETLENSPYEIAVLICLIKRLEKNIGDLYEHKKYIG